MTASEPPNEPVLKRVHAAAAEVYGDRLERVVLYGSRARGDHQPDSDYDIAVFIKNPGTLTEELDKLASLTTAILLDTGAVISPSPFLPGPIRRAPLSCTTSARTAAIYETRNGPLSHQSARMP